MSIDATRTRVWARILWGVAYLPKFLGTAVLKMRPLFTDGINSLAHVSFGVLGKTSRLLTVAFVAYQLLMPDPSGNILIDLGEFAVGYFIPL